MPRTARVAPGGMLFYVLNRGVGRMRLFLKDADFEAFERVIEKTLVTRPMRICAYLLMSNHWHFVLWPERDGDLGAFMQKLTITHVRNWQENRRRVGYGHLYQGRYKSFPVESDEHFYHVVRYVERNALRANLVDRAEEWRWSSLWRRECARGGRQAVARQVAAPPAAQLADLRKPAPNGRRAGSDPQERDPQPALRQHRLGAAGSQAIGIGVDAPLARPAQKEQLVKRNRSNN